MENQMKEIFNENWGLFDSVLEVSNQYSVFAEDRTSSFGMAKLTVSIGVTEHKIGLSKEELIRRVVNALLEAKQKGKNQVCVFK